MRISDWSSDVCSSDLELTIDDLKSRFENVTQRLWIECGGNGRAYFQPGASGNQWTVGAVGCPEWTGVRLKDVLSAAGVKRSEERRVGKECVSMCRSRLSPSL